MELEYHLLLSHDLDLLEAAEFEKLSEVSRRVQRMIGSLIHKVTKRSNAQT